MQQLVGIGRNEPCPCGSGRKYKKCCLDAHATAIAGSASELDVVALVNQAIETGDWEPLDSYVNRALELFERGAPLEHVRFRQALITSRDPDPSELAKLCTAGWLSRCQLELARVLDRYDLEPDERDGLRLAVHLVSRFGAQSPIVEELARLQVEECTARARRIATALSTSELTADTARAGMAELVDWLERVRPPILAFADWFALRVAPDDVFASVWSSTVSARISDVCLDRLDIEELDDRRWWALLAAITFLGTVPMLGEVLLTITPLRTPTADELVIYDALRKPQPGALRGMMQKIIDATEARGDYTGAALLRETMRMLQHDLR